MYKIKNAYEPKAYALKRLDHCHLLQVETLQTCHQETEILPNFPGFIRSREDAPALRRQQKVNSSSAEFKLNMCSFISNKTWGTSLINQQLGTCLTAEDE